MTGCASGITVGYLGVLLLLAVGLGWWAGRRAPIDVEYKLWLRFLRRSRRLMRSNYNVTL